MKNQAIKIACCLFFLICGLGLYLFLFRLPGFESWNVLPEELGWKGFFTAGVVLTALVTLIKEVWPPDMIMLVAAGILTVAGAITPEEFLRGFSRDIIATIAMLCILVRTLEVNGILNLLTRRFLPKSGSMTKGLFALLFPVSAMSAFLNNTAVVLMMTPITRKWALENRFSPSKFLIPLSYAAIVGGMCTLIGTSTNIIVDGLMREQDPRAGLSFFELAWVGVPISLFVLLFLLFFSHRLLPVREDIASALSRQTQEFTGEFDVVEGSPLIGQFVKDLAGNYFHGELLVEIERGGKEISVPGPYDVVLEGDRLIFAGDIDRIAELHMIKGLKSCADPHFKVKEGSTLFSEVVIAANSMLIGTTLRRVNFRNNYGASVLAIYRDGRRVEENVGDIVLEAGDTLMLLHGESWSVQRFSRDFYFIRHDELLTIFRPLRAALVLVICLSVVGLALLGFPLVVATLFAGLACILTRSITLREAQKSVIWNVLLLIASSFAVATAVEKTGVAALVADLLFSFLSPDPYVLIGGMLIIISLFTEVISNNAAALLIFPVVMKVIRLAGYEGVESIKTAGVAIAVGASCGFALPTGYQTNMIVYGPGGYRRRDFLLIGILANLIVVLIGAYLIPVIWPLS